MLYDEFSFTNFFIDLRSSYTQDRIVNASTIDGEFRQFISPVNTNRNFRSGVYTNFSTPLRFIKSKISIDANLRFDQGIFFLNDEQYDTERWTNNYSVTLENRNKEHVDIAVGMSMGTNSVKYPKLENLDQSYFDQTYFTDVVIYLPKNWSIESKFDYTFVTSGDFDVLAGTVNLNDGSVQQSGSAAVNIGTSGPANVDILNGSRITTGAGGLHVGAGGEIDVVGVGGDPSLIFANGPVTVDGGSLTVGNFGEFTMLGDDHTLVASNDAQVDFGFDQAIHSGRRYTVESGADATVGSLFVGGQSSGDGTLVVDGHGSTLTATSTTFVAQAAVTGRLSLSDGAVGDLRSVRIADGFNSADGLWVLSGGSQATTNSIDIATQSDSVGRLLVVGEGTLLQQRPGANLKIGSDTEGSALVTVETGATLVTGTPTSPSNASQRSAPPGHSGSRVGPWPRRPSTIPTVASLFLSRVASVWSRFKAT